MRKGFPQIFASLILWASASPGDEWLSGGATTVFQDGRNAFAMPLANISRENRRAHVIGNSFFNKNWVIAPASTTARDGLGPLFNARSCSECHLRDGRGAPPEEGESAVSLLLRLSLPGRDETGAPLPVPFFGTQLGVRAIPGVEPEGSFQTVYEEIPGNFADGTPYTLRDPVYQIRIGPSSPVPPAAMLFSPRIAPPVFGLGLLEAIPEERILSRADPNDRDGDGISGKPNYVWNPSTGEKELGRFGWKANVATIRQQTAGAFHGDIGITSSIHPLQALTPEQRRLWMNLHVDADPEIEDDTLERVVVYQQTLAPPARRRAKNAQVQRGKHLFHTASCDSCHTPEWTTGNRVPSIPELSDQVIYPYTDLLLHDMGPGLADGRPDFEASGVEWRTPPLWGIGLTEAVSGHTFFLHDGRARNLEEAILWHGGEAETSREWYRNFSREERRDLLAFLESL